MRATDVFVGAPSWSGRRSATDVGRASCEMKLRASDGRLADVEASFTTVELEGRKVDCIVARDISARKAAEHQVVENQRKLAHLAHHDPLTGLPNRLFLQQLIPEMLLRASARGEGMALLYVDVDHFKHINDSLGHSSGDQVLVSVARRLRNAIAAADLVVRMGGDEFVVVAGKIRDQAAARSIAERLMAALETPIRVDGRLIGLTASIGVSLYPRNGDDLESLLKHADMALYRAKERGRNAFQFFDTEMTQRVTERMLLEQALRHALGTEQLHLEYQPIVALADGALLGFEALLRWRHPELGPIAPGRFIPIAEQSGLIVELGESVLRLACAQIAQWSREGAPAVPVSINVSPRQLERDRFDYLVAAASREFGVSAQQLAFEITETALMQNAEAQLAALRGLRTRGSRVSIDDFGTGYSSLSYLKHLPIDTIKIDKAFVQDMTSDANDAAIVSAIVRMAGSLGLHTIAEGVETAEQVEALRRLGCRAAQGYYFGRPMPAEQCRALLDRAAPRSSLADTMKMRVKRALSL
jgi:diguanylate cyclase (GGDEF)-like protein